MPSLITILLLLSFLSFSTSSTLVVDKDNDPIQNDKSYYIYTEEGPLSYLIASVSGCPLVITFERDVFSSGTPVKISSPFGQKKIALEDRVTLAFTDTICKEESLVWKKTFVPFPGKEHVVIETGGDERDRSFSICESSETKNSKFSLYKLKYWSSTNDDAISSNVGLNGAFLELTEVSTPVWFEKAFDDVTELTSATS